LWRSRRKLRRCARKPEIRGNRSHRRALREGKIKNFVALLVEKADDLVRQIEMAGKNILTVAVLKNNPRIVILTFLDSPCSKP